MRGRFPVGAVEHAQAQVQRTETVAVAHRVVKVPLLGGALVANVIIIYYQRQAQAAAPAAEGPGAVIRQTEQLQHAPVTGQGGMGHGLSQLGRSIRMLDEIHLVDDIDQALRFDHAPEYLVDPQAQFPIVIAHVPEHQQVGFTQVHVGTSRVRCIVTEERRQCEAPARDILNVELRFQDKTAGVVTLAGMQGRLGIPAAFDAHTAGKIIVGNLNPRACDRRNDQRQQPHSPECRTEKARH